MRSNFIAFRAGIDLMVPIDRSLGGNAVGSRSVMQQRGSESVAVLASRPQLRKKAETSHGNASPRGPNIPRCTKSCSRMQRNACCSPPRASIQLGRRVQNKCYFWRSKRWPTFATEILRRVLWATAFVKFILAVRYYSFFNYFFIVSNHISRHMCCQVNLMCSWPLQLLAEVILN